MASSAGLVARRQGKKRAIWITSAFEWNHSMNHVFAAICRRWASVSVRLSRAMARRVQGLPFISRTRKAMSSNSKARQVGNLSYGAIEKGVLASRDPGAVVGSFRTVETRAARVLVLGSMPASAALLPALHYAHTHNPSWP